MGRHTPGEHLPYSGLSQLRSLLHLRVLLLLRLSGPVRLDKPVQSLGAAIRLNRSGVRNHHLALVYGIGPPIYCHAPFCRHSRLYFPVGPSTGILPALQWKCWSVRYGVPPVPRCRSGGNPKAGSDLRALLPLGRQPCAYRVFRHDMPLFIDVNATSRGLVRIDEPVPDRMLDVCCQHPLPRVSLVVVEQTPADSGVCQCGV